MFTMHAVAAALLPLVALEAIALRAKGMRGTSFNDYASSLFCGLLDQVINVGAFVAFVALFESVRQRFAPVILPSTAATWALAVLLHDLAYYAFHRASHRVAFLWAAHEVHHQSDAYTLAMSLRQGTIATWTSWAFYLPLALFGFSAEQFVIVHGAHQLFQFFVHTRLIHKLGPLEWLLATPSHHRVHHGRDEEQIDRNYGGFLIVWDRLFGTFTPEREEPIYGVPDGIESWSPYWANLAPYARLARKALAAGTVRGALAVVFGPPRSDHQRPRSWLSGEPPEADRNYAAIQSAGVLWVGNIVLQAHQSLGTAAQVALVLWLFASVGSISRILDERAGWRTVERARVALTAAGAIAFAGLGVTSWVPAIFWLAGCALSAYELGRHPR